MAEHQCPGKRVIKEIGGQFSLILKFTIFSTSPFLFFLQYSLLKYRTSIRGAIFLTDHCQLILDSAAFRKRRKEKLVEKNSSDCLLTTDWQPMTSDLELIRMVLCLCNTIKKNKHCDYSFKIEALTKSIDGPLYNLSRLRAISKR